MILEGIIKLFISLIPNFSIGLDIGAAVSQIAAYLAYANYFIALEDFGICALAVLGVWVACAVPSVLISLL